MRATTCPSLRPIRHPLRLPRPVRAAGPAGTFDRYLVDVDFDGPGGETRFAVGGGETLEEAIAAARGALPPGPWQVARWNHVYD